MTISEEMREELLKVAPTGDGTVDEEKGDFTFYPLILFEFLANNHVFL